MAMGGGQITQNVVPSNPNSQEALGPSGGPQGQLSMQPGGMGPQQIGPGAQAAMMAQQQQRPPFDSIEMARQQNLMKIHQLRQTLEAAQQQEAQYKSQIEVSVCMIVLSYKTNCFSQEHTKPAYYYETIVVLCRIRFNRRSRWLSSRRCSTNNSSRQVIGRLFSRWHSEEIIIHNFD